MNKNKSTFRMYKTKGDYRLLNIYNICQDALNSVLSNNEFVKKLIDIKLTNDNGKNKLIGDLWKDIRTIFKLNHKSNKNLNKNESFKKILI